MDSADELWNVGTVRSVEHVSTDPKQLKKRRMMWIFKYLTECYCKKILDVYLSRANDQTYKGIEFPLFDIRNKSALNLIETISQIQVNGEADFAQYFKRVTELISTSLSEVSKAVNQFNLEHKTNFTTDLFEHFFSSSLTRFISSLNEIVKQSPIFINDIDEALYLDDRDTPWICHFSFVLYQYILEKEFALIVQKSDRDIFDKKKLLVLQCITQAADIYTNLTNEDDDKYKEQMNTLLQSMRTKEHDLQQRRTSEPAPFHSLSYWTQTLHKAHEKIRGKGTLGKLIEQLIEEFSERNAPKILWKN